MTVAAIPLRAALYLRVSGRGQRSATQGDVGEVTYQ